MENLLTKIKEILEEALYYGDLNKEIETVKFIDKQSKKEYDTLEDAFAEGITDFSNFEEVTKRINPKEELSKMIKEDGNITSNDVAVVDRFNKLVKELDSDKEYKRQYNKLQNQKNKARKQGDDKKVEELNKEVEKLNKQYGKVVRKKKK